jgi:hypothetical protein
MDEWLCGVVVEGKRTWAKLCIRTTVAADANRVLPNPNRSINTAAVLFTVIV